MSSALTQCVMWLHLRTFSETCLLKLHSSSPAESSSTGCNIEVWLCWVLASCIFMDDVLLVVSHLSCLTAAFYFWVIWFSRCFCSTSRGLGCRNHPWSSSSQLKPLAFWSSNHRAGPPPPTNPLASHCKYLSNKTAAKKPFMEKEKHLQGLRLVWLITLDYGSIRGGYIRSLLFENVLKARVVKPVLNLQCLLGSGLNAGKIHKHTHRGVGGVNNKCQSYCVRRLLAGMSHLEAPSVQNKSRSKPSDKLCDLTQNFLFTFNTSSFFFLLYVVM